MCPELKTLSQGLHEKTVPQQHTGMKPISLQDNVRFLQTPHEKANPTHTFLKQRQ